MTSKGVLVVTGGSRGIGAATAVLAAERGYAVVVNYAGNVEAAEASARHPRSRRRGRRGARRCQPTRRCRAHLRRRRPAGDAHRPRQQCRHRRPTRAGRRMDAARINRILAVNVTGSFLCARAAIRRMSTKHGGKGGGIVNLCSARGQARRRPASMSTTRPPRAPSTPSPSASRSKSRRRHPRQRRAARHHRHRHPRLAAAIRTARRSMASIAADGARRAPPTKSPAPSSGCSRTKPPTRPARRSRVTGGRAIRPERFGMPAAGAVIAATPGRV